MATAIASICSGMTLYRENRSESPKLKAHHRVWVHMFSRWLSPRHLFDAKVTAVVCGFHLGHEVLQGPGQGGELRVIPRGALSLFLPRQTSLPTNVLVLGGTCSSGFDHHGKKLPKKNQLQAPKIMSDQGYSVPEFALAEHGEEIMAHKHPRYT